MQAARQKKTSYKIGIDAELAAIEYYAKFGFTLLKHRYKTKYGEIDLIFQKGDLIVFVEVKARKNLEHQELITSKQQRRLFNTVLLFMSEIQMSQELALRFDVYISTPGMKPQVIENAFDFSQFSA